IVQHISEPLTILADRKKLLQVLMNLTKNGIEAMPNGGTLHLRCYRQNEFACIEVIDTGVGMSQANLQRLGNPFYSTKEKGTGLGLMVSYRIVEAMNGKIRVSSQPEKGTRFTLLFPLYS
ncbi:MAG: ATP-binding protein, partial [Tumebacillaceae bacterium]